MLKQLIKCIREEGAFFKEHLKRKRIMDEKYFIQALGYIHLNPVKHGFTDDFRDYPYSSYKAFVSNRKSNVDKKNCLWNRG